MSKKSKKTAPKKSDVRALAAREAELEREINRREKKAAKKALKRSDEMLAADAKKAKKKAAKTGNYSTPEPSVKPKKGKKAKAGKVDPSIVIVASPEAPLPAVDPEVVADAVERAKPKAGAEMTAQLEADTKAGKKRRDAGLAQADAEMKARVESKRRLREMQAEGEKRAEKIRAAGKAAEPIAREAEVTAAEPAQVAEVVETETGREFAVGAPVDETFAKPSESPLGDFRTNGNGQYVVKRPSDDKEVGYTRVTTYISCLEDTTKLTEWKLRVLLEGVAVIDGPEGDPTGEHGPITARVNDLVHRRDVTISKARKADRKGKLTPGELGRTTATAWSEFKKALDALAEEAFAVGGGREKAAKGTDIHALCDLYDREGIEAVGDLLTDGKITPADLADVEAYADAMRRLGAKIIEAERVIVNDALKVAGRLDRVVMVRLPGELRARRRVLDIKTGRVDYGTGKIAQQIEMYAGAIGYDLETHEREDLKVDRTKGLLLHLPAGEARATVHVVDLGLGRRGNKLAGEVRSWRNEGKRAIDLKVDVLEALDAEREAEAPTEAATA